MKCKKVRKMLLDYIDETIDPEARLLVQKHIGECSSCRQELEALKKLLGLIHGVKVDYPPASVWENFLPDLHRRIEKEAISAFSGKQKRRNHLLLGWASVVIIVVLTLSSFNIVSHYPSGGSIKVPNIGSRSQPLLTENSESVLVAEVISKVLITEEEAEKLKRLGNLINPEAGGSPYHRYDSILSYVGEEDDREDGRGVIRQLLDDEFEEYYEGYITDFYTSVPGTM